MTQLHAALLDPMEQSKARRTYEQDYVRSLFDTIAWRYDFLNRFLSVGLDILWRRKTVELLWPLQPEQVLDVATGTGDLAIQTARRLHANVVGIDISQQMLGRGREKVRRLNMADRITLQEGAAEQLMFPSSSFDAVTVGFGARNFELLDRGLSEMYRVLRKGGMIAILEFSQPKSFPVQQLFGFYFHRIVPFIGGVISGNKEAYEYLPKTVSEFPDGNDFLRMLESTGFREAAQHVLTFGVVSVYTGVKQ